MSIGLACVEKGGKWGFINTSGAWAIQPIYDNAFSFHNGLARVSKAGKWGMIDATGKMVIAPLYARLYDVSDGLIAASFDEHHYGYLSPNGKVALDFIYKLALPFDEQTHKAIATTEQGDYYIDRHGALLGKLPNKEEEEERERREGRQAERD